MSNFTFLNKEYPEIANTFQLAETYLYTDPASFLVKLRTGCEYIISRFYQSQRFFKYPNATFSDLLQGQDFKKAVPSPILDLLHVIRKSGNKAAHEFEVVVNTKTLIENLNYVYQISNWFYNVTVDSSHKMKPFQVPVKQPTVSELLEALKKKDEEAIALFAELKKQSSKEEQNKNSQKVKAEGEAFVETIGLTEAQTRSILIDQMFKDAGWDLHIPFQENERHSGKYRLVDEFKVTLLSGRTGYVDYVLMGNDDLPLALLEAKKTSSSAENGKAQALEYANALERQFGKRPIIFYSNGHDTFIWQDSILPPRKIWGIYTSEKLEYVHFQKENRKELKDVSINTKIIDREFQLEGVRRVLETYEKKHRKALIVMATGTGKTRVAIAISDTLLKANWARRILFLADRRELRDQAEDAFKENIPSSPYTKITSQTSAFDKSNRLFTSTYQTMMEKYLDFPVDFFDLIIADESHRSIYNYYRELFLYFDSLQLGLTATPINLISRNTFRFFDTDDKDPTFAYSYKQAVENNPPYLVRYKAIIQSSGFIRKGIKYKDLSEEQIRQLEDSDIVPDKLDFDREEVDRAIMNKDTNERIIRNLMENGIRDATGNDIGKTILFARSIPHAELILSLFNEMYPHYNGKFAEVITSESPRASEMLKGFKGKNTEFEYIQLAISVDMLDTGVDVPAIVNLVFAKPVYSYVKFQQMIGRGTRLKENLFGPGKHKTHFLIFDHWENFSYFDENPEGGLKENPISITEQLFKERIGLLEKSIEKNSLEERNVLVALLKADIASLPEKSISVKEKWKELEKTKNPRNWETLDSSFLNLLKVEITPLMRWRQIGSEEDAIRFDKNVTELQKANLINDADAFVSIKESILSNVSKIRRNLNQVKPHLEYIDFIQTSAFWENSNFQSLEEMRKKLRDLMKFRVKRETVEPIRIDVSDPLFDPKTREDSLSFADMEVYKKRVVEAVEHLADSNIVIQKIRNAKPLNRDELYQLQNLVLEQKTNLTLDELRKKFSTITSLELFLRTILGLEPEKVRQEFKEFREEHTTLTANQIQFLNLLEQEILNGGGIWFDKLYDMPYTRLHKDSIDGIFPSEEAEDLFSLLEPFRLDKAG